MNARLEALAAVGLSGADAPLPRSGWGPWLATVAEHGLAGFLLKAAADGHVDLTDDELFEAGRRHGEALVHTLATEAQLLRLQPVLDTFEVVVLKGPALAHGAYAAPELRIFTDLDLLAPPARLPDLVAALERWGYRRAWEDPSPAFLRHVPKAVAMQHPSTGLLVDVHRTLAGGHLGDRVDVAGIHRRAAQLCVGDNVVRVPSAEDHLVAAAVHAVVGDRGLRPVALRDVAQLLVAGADHEVATRRAEEWQLGGVLATGLTAMRDAFGLALPPDLARWVRGRPAVRRDAALRAALAAPDASRRLRRLELLHARPRHRLELLRAELAPSPAFLRSRYGPGPLPRLYRRHWGQLFGPR